jgi:hypothetical protein
MRYGAGRRVPLPTKSEIDEAAKLGREIVACSALRYRPLIYMKVAFHNGDTSTVSLGTNGGFRLLRALKTIVPDTEHTGVAPATMGEFGLQLQEGDMSA